MSGATMPGDTATAAINIAHNPAANITALYGLSSASPPFGPALTAQPNDFTVSIFYSNDVNEAGLMAVDGAGDLWWGSAASLDSVNGQGFDRSGGLGYGGLPNLSAIALDVNGNLWGTMPPSNPGATNGLGELSNSGTLLSPAGGYNTGLGITNPTSLAMDASSNAWIANSIGGNLIKVSSTGTLSGSFTGHGLAFPEGVAIDPSGNAWVADTNSIVEVSSTGSPLADYSPQGVNGASQIALDHAGNVWVINAGTGTVSEISSTGNLLSPAAGYTGHGINGPQGIAIDGAGNAWISGQSSITEISPTGTFLSGTNGFTGAVGIYGIAVDGSGDVWTNYESFNFLFGTTFYLQELVGAATPVVTPLAVGVKNNTLGARP